MKKRYQIARQRAVQEFRKLAQGCELVSSTNNFLLKHLLELGSIAE